MGQMGQLPVMNNGGQDMNGQLQPQMPNMMAPNMMMAGSNGMQHLNNQMIGMNLNPSNETEGNPQNNPE